MNMAISFFVGCLTLVLIMIIKIPLKKMNLKVAQKRKKEEQQRILYRRLNLIIILVVMVISAFFYYVVLMLLGEEHFKLCCSMKAGAIAVALYAVFEQWFGENL